MDDTISTHPAIRSLKRELRIVRGARVHAGMPKVTVDAGSLEYIIEQVERVQELEEVNNRIRVALEWIVECSVDYQSIIKARNALVGCDSGEGI